MENLQLLKWLVGFVYPKRTVRVPAGVSLRFLLVSLFRLFNSPSGIPMKSKRYSAGPFPASNRKIEGNIEGGNMFSKCE